MNPSLYWGPLSYYDEYGLYLWSRGLAVNVMSLPSLNLVFFRHFNRDKEWFRHLYTFQQMVRWKYNLYFGECVIEVRDGKYWYDTRFLNPDALASYRHIRGYDNAMGLSDPFADLRRMALG